MKKKSGKDTAELTSKTPFQSDIALGMRPCPSDLPQTINPEASPKRAGVETHRNLNCNHYDNCLDEAVRRGWQSFTCLKCPLCALTTPPQVSIESYATQRRAI